MKNLEQKCQKGEIHFMSFRTNSRHTRHFGTKFGLKYNKQGRESITCDKADYKVFYKTRVEPTALFKTVQQ